MRDDSLPQPFLVAFPDDEVGPRILLDPQYFTGLDEVGDLLAHLAQLYARAFVQSGRAQDMRDALEQIQDMFDSEMAAVDFEALE